MGQLLTQAGYSVRSGAESAPPAGDTSAFPRDRADEIIVQMGRVDDQPLLNGAMETRFPMLQMALCCWLVGSVPFERANLRFRVKQLSTKRTDGPKRGG
jgi:hypothetical protein